MLSYDNENKVDKEEVIKLYQKGLNAESIARTLRSPWAKVWPVIRRLKNEKQ